MKRLPVWMIAIFAVLATLLMVVGWRDRHEASYFPFVMGCLWALFTLASAGRAFSDD